MEGKKQKRTTDSIIKALVISWVIMAIVTVIIMIFWAPKIIIMELDQAVIKEEYFDLCQIPIQTVEVQEKIEELEKELLVCKDEESALCLSSCEYIHKIAPSLALLVYPWFLYIVLFPIIECINDAKQRKRRLKERKMKH